MELLGRERHSGPAISAHLPIPDTEPLLQPISYPRGPIQRAKATPPAKKKSPRIARPHVPPPPLKASFRLRWLGIGALLFIAGMLAQAGFSHRWLFDVHPLLTTRRPDANSTHHSNSSSEHKSFGELVDKNEWGRSSPSNNFSGPLYKDHLNTTGTRRVQSAPRSTSLSLSAAHSNSSSSHNWNQYQRENNNSTSGSRRDPDHYTKANEDLTPWLSDRGEVNVPDGALSATTDHQGIRKRPGIPEKPAKQIYGLDTSLTRAHPKHRDGDLTRDVEANDTGHGRVGLKNQHPNPRLPELASLNAEGTQEAVGSVGIHVLKNRNYNSESTSVETHQGGRSHGIDAIAGKQQGLKAGQQSTIIGHVDDQNDLAVLGVLPYPRRRRRPKGSQRRSRRISGSKQSYGAEGRSETLGRTGNSARGKGQVRKGSRARGWNSYSSGVDVGDMDPTSLDAGLEEDRDPPRVKRRRWSGRLRRRRKSRPPAEDYGMDDGTQVQSTSNRWNQLGQWGRRSRRGDYSGKDESGVGDEYTRDYEDPDREVVPIGGNGGWTSGRTQSRRQPAWKPTRVFRGGAGRPRQQDYDGVDSDEDPVPKATKRRRPTVKEGRSSRYRASSTRGYDGGLDEGEEDETSIRSDGSQPSKWRHSTGREEEVGITGKPLESNPSGGHSQGSKVGQDVAMKEDGPALLVQPKKRHPWEAKPDLAEEAAEESPEYMGKQGELVGNPTLGGKTKGREGSVGSLDSRDGSVGASQNDKRGGPASSMSPAVSPESMNHEELESMGHERAGKGEGSRGRGQHGSTEAPASSRHPGLEGSVSQGPAAPEGLRQGAAERTTVAPAPMPQQGSLREGAAHAPAQHQATVEVESKPGALISMEVVWRGAVWNSEIGSWLSRCHESARGVEVSEPLHGKECPDGCNGDRGQCSFETGQCHCRLGFNGAACAEESQTECTSGEGVKRSEDYPCAGECDKSRGVCLCGKGTLFPARPISSFCGLARNESTGEWLPDSLDRDSLFSKDTTSPGWCNALVPPEGSTEVADGENKLIAEVAPPRTNCECLLDGLGGPLCSQVTESFCVNQCSGKGECLGGHCRCQGGFHGVDCSMVHDGRLPDSPLPEWLAMVDPGESGEAVSGPKVEVAASPESNGRRRARRSLLAGEDARKEVKVRKVRPLIYIYEMPEQFGGHILQGRAQRHGCVPRTYDSRNRTVFSRGHKHGLELALLEGLLSSRHRTSNPEEADYFYVPVLGSCFMERARQGSTGSSSGNARAVMELYQEALEHIKSAFPYWGHKAGRDHVWSLGWNEGACLAPGSIWNSILLSHWGNAGAVHKGSITTPAAERWDNTPVFLHGGHPCFDSAKDIVMPAWTVPAANTLKERTWEKPLEKRPVLFFFRGDLGLNYEGDLKEHNFSMGIRQALASAFSSSPDSQGHLGTLAEDGVVVLHSREEGGKDPSSGQGPGDAKFCGVIPGVGFSGSMEEAMSHGCIPVIIQDGIQLPWESVLNYTAFGVRIRQKDIRKLVKILRALEEPFVEQLQKHVQAEWSRWHYASLFRAEGRRQTALGFEPTWAGPFEEIKSDDAIDTLMQVLHFKLHNDPWRKEAALPWGERKRTDLGIDKLCSVF